ncbi:diphosphoinositol polyphosphate phosphohydrolase 2-like [Liolophura sinensis]|uniref:diphosphoinositol polyphosphate phosphohydrolase 2-like n=1 Tax=Liolophura sinensis TaxID=3198878 RepID=UPI0031599455
MPKVKPGSTRTYDKEGYRLRAAAICVRDPNENEVLLVSSTIDSDKWVMPGGGVEPWEDPESAALREAYEEAGIRGHVIGRHGIVEDASRRERTWVFSLGVVQLLNTWPESERLGRKRKWFDLDDARNCLALYKPFQVKCLEAMLR